MADENYKLAKFQSAVFAEVDMKAEQIKHDAENFKDHELEKNKDNRLDKSYHLIQKRSEQIKKENKREVAKYSLDSKRSVLTKRNEITKTIFDEIQAKLIAFSNSNEYKTYIISAISAFSTKNKLENVEISLKKSDMKFKDEIAKAYALSCEIVENNNILIGGFVAKNAQSGIYFDETLEQKLKDQTSFFIEKSNLTV